MSGQRIVTTPKSLYALPDGTLIRDREGRPLEKRCGRWSWGWRTPDVPLPATILWEGGADE